MAVTLVGYHFPKTGGTSIHAHALLHLGEDQHYTYGPYSDTKRLYASKPILAELDDAEAERIRFVFGHAVSFTTAQLLPRNDIALFAVCRHPAERFVSSYKHHVRHRRTSTPESARSIFAKQKPSPFAQELMNRFGVLADPNARTEEEKLISVLQVVRFLVPTDRLGERSGEIFSAVGVPPFSWKRRAHNEEADLGDLTPEEIVERDHLDMLIYTEISKSSDGRHPFGYRPDRLDRVRKAAAQQCADKDRARRDYFRLFEFHKSDGRIHATKLFLQHRGRPSARRFFDEYCTQKKLDLHFSDLPARNWCYLSEVYGMLGDRMAQHEAADAAIAAQADSPQANFIAGRSSFHRGDYDRAAHLLAAAIRLNHTMPEAWAFSARAANRLGKRDEAIAAIDEALRLNPDSQKYKRIRERLVSRTAQPRKHKPQPVHSTL